MKYTKEVTEARKVYDSLVIEQREAKKELEAVKAEIRAKLDGKPSPHKFEDLKKQEAKLEARLADLPALIADARDALITALWDYKKQMADMATKAADNAFDALLPEIKRFIDARDALGKALTDACKPLGDLAGEPAEIPVDWLLEESLKIFMSDRMRDGSDLGFKERMYKRLDGRLHEIAANYAYQLRLEAERIKNEQKAR